MLNGFGRFDPGQGPGFVSTTIDIFSPYDNSYVKIYGLSLFSSNLL
jgi:hypothetical protein